MLCTSLSKLLYSVFENRNRRQTLYAHTSTHAHTHTQRERCTHTLTERKREREKERERERREKDAQGTDTTLLSVSLSCVVPLRACKVSVVCAMPYTSLAIVSLSLMYHVCVHMASFHKTSAPFAVWCEFCERVCVCLCVMCVLNVTIYLFPYHLSM